MVAPSEFYLAEAVADCRYATAACLIIRWTVPVPTPTARATVWIAWPFSSSR